MRKISSLLLFILLLSGCYEDKGNYDYKLETMNEIKSVTFSPPLVESADSDRITGFPEVFLSAISIISSTDFNSGCAASR
ncbi:MAG: hypothetical protein IKL29_02755, partial [Bacteroidaceae bacterium]|nr:hypothetical protein [Bacteroidaceae bacterium]